MVEALVVCFFFSLSLSGWGHFIWKLLFSDRPSIPDSLLFGMIFTAQLGLWLHFFTPLSPLIVVTMTIVGILFFIKDYFFKNQNKFPKKIFFLTGLIGFLLMVGYALDSNLYSDVVGYHFPALNWMIHQKIIFGLANLQDRFGFNSIWYIISALSNPLMRWQSSVEYGSIALLWIYFMSGFYLPKGIQALGWICRAVAFILWGKQAFLINLGLPATDLPSALCCLIFYERIFISYNQNKLEYYKLLQIIFIYIFAVQLKLSQIFLGLPLLALVFSFRKEAFLSEAKNWWRYLIFVFGMIFPWALRTYFLSGCWLFPIAKSCFPVVSWRLPLPEVKMAKYYIQSWAKIPRGGAVVELFSDWLPSWVQMQWSKPHIQILILSALIFFFLNIFKSKYNQKNNEITDNINPVSRWFYISIGLIFLIWFFQAPDPRFIMGSFIFLQGLIFYKIFKKIKFLLKSPKLLLVARVIGFIGLGFYFLDLFRICKNSITRYPIIADRFLESDLYSMEKKESLNGVLYLVPDMIKDTESGCWLTVDLCANQVRPLLFKTNFGSYTVFESKEAGGHE